MRELRGISYALALMVVVALGFRLIAVGQAPTTDWAAIGSLVQGIVAVIAAVLTYRALRVAAHSADAARISADAAKIAADIANESAASTKRIERSYIDFGLDEDPRLAVKDGYLGYQMMSYNLGKTPAIVRLIRFELIECEEPPPLPTVEEFLKNALPHTTAVGAGSSVPVKKLALQIGVKFVYLVAAEYTDIFGTRSRATAATFNEVLPHGVNQKAFVGGEEWNVSH